MAVAEKILPGVLHDNDNFVQDFEFCSVKVYLESFLMKILFKIGWMIVDIREFVNQYGKFFDGFNMKQITTLKSILDVKDVSNYLENLSKESYKVKTL